MGASLPGQPVTPAVLSSSAATSGTVRVGSGDCGRLLELLARVPDPRLRRGIRHRLAGVLAVAAAAVLAGCRSVLAITEWAAEAPQPVLAALGARRDPRTGRWQAPSEDAAPLVRSPRDHPWMMDVFDAVVDSDIFWFRWRLPLAPDATPFAHALGPSDRAHGLVHPSARGRAAVEGWPNADVSVRAARAPVEGWTGLRPYTIWDRTGVGVGGATLLDCHGDYGSVAMGVELVPSI